MPHLKFSTDNLTWNTATFNDYISTTSWSTINSNFGNTIVNSTVYGNNIWVAVGDEFQIRRSTDAITWTTVTSNFTSSVKINSITYGNNLFVAGGDAGQMRRSTDGTTWTTLAPNFGSTVVRSVAYGNGIWVAVGYGGTIRRSTDSISWSIVTSNFGTTIILSTIFDNSNFIAAGSTGQIRRSTDGTTWTTVVSNFGSTQIRSIAYGNGMWVAGGLAGQARISTDSVTWTSTVTNFGNTTIESIFYGNGLWLFAGNSGLLHSSTDNLVWTTLNSNFGITNITSIRYGNGLWIATGGSGQIRISSNPERKDNVIGNFVNAENTNFIWGALTTTGQVWMNHPTDKLINFNVSPSYPESIKQLTTYNNEFITLFNNEVRTSSDLLLWTTSIYLNWTTVRNSPFAISNPSGNFSPLYANGQWMFPGTSSTDLINWTTVVVGNTTNLRSIVYENNTWMIGSAEAAFTSTDGTTWTTRSVAPMASNNINAIGYGNGLWVVAGQNGRAARSTDTINWVTTNIMFGNTTATSIAYGNGIWVAVGYGASTGINQGRISNSTDGITWTSNFNSNFFESSINSVAYSNGLWVAVGESRSAIRIRTSTNGINWSTVTNAPFGTALNLKSVVYAGGVWAAAGNYATNSMIIKSTDGTNWTTVNSSLGVTNISIIRYGNGQWIVNNNSSTTRIYKSLNLENSVNANKIIKTQNDQEMLILANNGEIYKKLKYDILWTGINTGINDNFINGSIGLDYSSINIDNTGRFWTSITLPIQVSTSANNNRNIAYSNNKWVIASSSNIILYSTNLVSWATVTPVGWSPSTISYVGNVNDIWFTLSANNHRRSTDGITWNTITIDTTGYPLSDMAYGQGVWMASGGQGGVPMLVRSTDSVNWQQINSGFGATINSIAYGNGIFVIAGSRASSQGGQISISTNGLSWTIRPSFLGLAGGALFNYIRYKNNFFLVKAVGNDTMFRSTDAVNWTYLSIGGGTTYSEAFDYYNGMYMMGTNTVYKSTDTITWTSNIPYSLNINAGGAIFGSDTWAYISNGLSQTIYITPQMYNYRSVILQGNNASYYSTDMISWTTIRTVPAANTVNAIISKD